MTAPVASGWSELAGWGFHPLESAAFARRTPRADHRADIGKCPLLEDEPPFLPGTGPPLKTLPFLFHIYFSDRLPRATFGLMHRSIIRSDHLT